MTNTSKLIDQQIAGIADWRGKTMARLRKVIRSADSKIEEELKWSTPVFTHNGNLCALGVFKDHVKINFFKGASLNDPQKLFNAGLEAKTSRGIDIHQGEKIDETALKTLVKAAIVLNKS